MSQNETHIDAIEACTALCKAYGEFADAGDEFDDFHGAEAGGGA